MEFLEEATALSSMPADYALDVLSVYAVRERRYTHALSQCVLCAQVLVASFPPCDTKNDARQRHCSRSSFSPCSIGPRNPQELRCEVLRDIGVRGYLTLKSTTNTAPLAETIDRLDMLICTADGVKLSSWLLYALSPSLTKSCENWLSNLCRCLPDRIMAPLMLPVTSQNGCTIPPFGRRSQQWRTASCAHMTKPILDCSLGSGDDLRAGSRWTERDAQPHPAAHPVMEKSGQRPRPRPRVDTSG